MSEILHSYKYNRSALEISGKEADTFLNDILTAELVLLPCGKMRMSCLLSPQGRILHDMLIYRIRSDCYWIEVASNKIQDLKNRIVMYRLRKEISVDILENWYSAHLYHRDGSSFSPKQIALVTGSLEADEFSFEDSRRPELGLHIISKERNVEAQKKGWVNVSFIKWESIRIANMVPSGDIDLTPNRSLLLEANLELFSAVDFQKGCYIGQEVTARTKYRGLVKKKIVPISSKVLLEKDEPIFQEGKKIGVCNSAVKLDGGRFLALATLRIEAIKANIENKVDLESNTASVNIELPSWHKADVFSKKRK